MSLTKKSLLPRKWRLGKNYNQIIEMLVDKSKSFNGHLYCKSCGSPHNIDLHHKLMRSSVSEDVLITDKEGRVYYRNSWRNLIALCHSCHIERVHKNPQWARENNLIQARNAPI